MKCFWICCLIAAFSLSAAAEEVVDTPEEAYWDYGIGLGAVHYEQYPAADQFSDLAIPAPTFQYRGKILRADDRDGAHLYLFKSGDLTVELSGVGYPALDSSNNEAREGMDNLPWMLALGPQMVSRHVKDFEFGLGVYQVITTDFDMTRFQGGIFEGKITYLWDGEWTRWGFFEQDGTSDGRLSFSIKYGSAEMQSLYYQVPTDKVTAQRAFYEAQDGLLSQDLSFYQSWKSGRFSIGVGASLGFYGEAANRQSSLHRSDMNLTGAIGINYVLGESKKPAVLEEDTSGLINNLRKNRQLKDTY